jgi:hypothetical protein
MAEPSVEQQLANALAEVDRLKNADTSTTFIQMLKFHQEEMKKLSHLSSAAHVVLLTLIKQMGQLNTVMISIDAICKLADLSPSTVKRGIGILREENWLAVLKIGTANVYRVNSDVLWQDRPDGKWAAFSGNIVVDFDEQDELTKKKPIFKTRRIPLVEADDGM